MSWSKTYSVKTDFDGVINTSQLHDEISAYFPILDRIDQSGDLVTIWFNDRIEDRVTLSAIIAAHVPSKIPVFTKQELVTIANPMIHTSDYTRLEQIILKRCNYINVALYSNMDSDVTSYSIRLFNKTANKVLLEKTYTNTTEIINDLGTTQLNSNTFTILEFQAKYTTTNPNASAYVYTITVSYNE